MLGQGAVLLDERDLGSEPWPLFCLEHGLQEGRKNSRKQQLISNRLQFLEISRRGDVNLVGSAPFLDYRPLKEAEQLLVAPLLQESWLAQDWDALVLQHAMTKVGGLREAITKAQCLAFVEEPGVAQILLGNEG